MVEGGVTMLSVLLIMLFSIQPSTTHAAYVVQTWNLSILWHECTAGNNYTQGGQLEKNLQHVFGDLPNQTASSIKGYTSVSYGESPDTVNALSMCRGDQTETECRDCVRNATSALLKLCGRSPGGNDMPVACYLRWENNLAFANVMDSKTALIRNGDEALNTSAYSRTVNDLFTRLITAALQNNNSKRYASGNASVDSVHEIYGLVQCWGDLENDDCRSCFGNLYDQIAMASTIKSLLVFTGTCMAEYRYSIFFATNPDPATHAPAPTTNSNSEEKSENKHALILGLVGGSMLLLLFLVSSYCFMACRKRQPSQAGGPNGGFETDEDQNICFTLETLMVATSNFHDNYKLGEGGFGVVYKGTLLNGKDVAIKKLSLRSLQGKKEFTTEIRLVTRIQHRNLVNLLGCCIDGSERILVYEYLANKSLDKHLFDLEHKRFLDWEKRMNIILGVAKGLLYLHEDSKLRIIHRDIKASNILLDDNFNAKIADFGLAKLFSEDESCVQTRVAGTIGYMAPEYAMNGELSAKADVYSFGILILEITSGRRINDIASNSNLNLLGRAWKLYRRGEFLKLVDTDLKEAHNYEQIVRCNHVGLLCTQADPSLRPLMSEVIMMLSTNSVSLPNPTTPAFISTTTTSTLQRNVEFSSPNQNLTPYVSHFPDEMSSSDSITTLVPR